MKKPTTPPALRDQCLGHSKILGIPITPEALDAVLDRANKEALSHLKFLDLLLGQQAVARRDRSIEYRMRQARFAERQTLETFDWKFNAHAIDRLQIEELASGDFIRRQSNLIFVGQSGVGKSHHSSHRDARLRSWTPCSLQHLIAAARRLDRFSGR